MDFTLLMGGLAAALFGIYADLAFNLFSATNSSPQTTELNARQRAKTLMKYVTIADVSALFFGVVGAAMTYSSKSTRKLWPWPLIGAGLVVVVMHTMYVHARNAGTRTAAAQIWKEAIHSFGTETYIPSG